MPAIAYLSSEHLLHNAVIKKIEPQFGDTPEDKLMCAVVGLAIKDLLDIKHRAGAIYYLNHDLAHATLCGVEPQWIRSVLRKCKVNLEN